MRLGEILKKIEDSGGMATSRSLATMLNIRKDRASAYMSKLHKKGWISKERTTLTKGGYNYVCTITPKGAKYLSYMEKISQKPKLNADQIIMDLENEIFIIRSEHLEALGENIELLKETMKKDDEIKSLKSDKDFWLFYSLKMENNYGKMKDKYNGAMKLALELARTRMR